MKAGKVRKAALLIASGAAAVFGAGCGSSGQATEAGLRLQREDLIAAARALERASGEVSGETAATKVAWRYVANGLSHSPSGPEAAAIAKATRVAAALKLPSVFDESNASGLTGPAASISGAFRSFQGLANRGWQMISYTLARERSAERTGAGFARANVALYIESVYDGHFGLAQIGKKLLAGWEKLGGTSAFGASLPRAEVERLARLYSERSFRLHPHDGVKLGS